QGFAITLLIGLFCSLFTAIFLTKLFIDRRLEQGKNVEFFTNITKNWFQGLNVDFMAKRKMFYIISTVVSLACIAIIFVRGFDMGVDFEGGRTYTIRFEQPVNANEIRTGLEQTLTDDDGTTTAPTVKIFGPSNQ